MISPEKHSIALMLGTMGDTAKGPLILCYLDSSKTRLKKILFLIPQPQELHYRERERINTVVNWWSQGSMPCFPDSQAGLPALYHTTIHRDLILEWPRAEASRMPLRILFIGRPESSSFHSLCIHSSRVFMQALESRYQPQGHCINQRGAQAPLAGGQASLATPPSLQQAD